MLDKLITYGISVSGVGTEITDEVTNSPKEIAAWIIALIAVIVASILISKYGKSIIDSVKSKKSELSQKKIEDERNAELERLHKIKEKNKRK